MPTPVRRQAMRHYLPLLLLLAGAVTLIETAGHFSTPAIDAARRAYSLSMVNRVMPLPHDNDTLADTSSIQLPGQQSATALYRARRAGQPVGLVMLPVTARGYVDAMDLAVGIAYDGTVTGVEVVRHRETPGLGDRVHQNHSDWLKQFRGHSLENPDLSLWAVRGDGGAFDQLSGATITPRGVVNAVRRALEYHAANRDALYR